MNQSVNDNKVYAKGGNADRDAKFLSEQKHEQDYEPKRKKAYKKYKRKK